MAAKDINETVEDLTAGDLERVVHKYGNLVYMIVLSKLRGSASHDEIKDCVSDVFAEIFSCVDKFSAEKGSLKNYISAIARNTALNAYHRLSYRKSKIVSIDDEDTELPVSEHNTESEVETRIEHEHLYELVKQLGEPDSVILMYQYFYDLKIREIAVKLSMTPDAVQKRSLRARKRLRDILEAERSF